VRPDPVAGATARTAASDAYEIVTTSGADGGI
jgi:hypothetical protein